jgi:AcrR family transcriptional regulator
MKATLKLSSEERRSAIVRAVRKVFAERGFHGTTTRALADAAGVSEALLFKHFPNKEALYSAMQLACCNDNGAEQLDRIKSLKPSTSTLVLMVHWMVARTLGTEIGCQEDAATHHRLLLRSMIEDGEFARLFYERTMPCWISKVEECLHEAIQGGEADSGPLEPKLAALFARQLSKTVMVSLLPATPIVDYGVPREKLAEQVVWFVLRGLGVRDEAIRRYYNPDALAIFMA